MKRKGILKTPFYVVQAFGWTDADGTDHWIDASTPLPMRRAAVVRRFLSGADEPLRTRLLYSHTLPTAAGM